MKRDMDLVRKILLKLEELPYSGGFIHLVVEGYSENEVSYHVMLLAEAGLIDATDCSTLTSQNWEPIRLTWSGHEFVEASRDETRWEKAKVMMKEKGSGLVFSVLQNLLVQLMSKAILGQ